MTRGLVAAVVVDVEVVVVVVAAQSPSVGRPLHHSQNQTDSFPVTRYHCAIMVTSILI